MLNVCDIPPEKGPALKLPKTVLGNWQDIAGNFWKYFFMRTFGDGHQGKQRKQIYICIKNLQCHGVTSNLDSGM